MTTTFQVTVDGTDVSNYVRKIETWRKATEGIGRFEITLLNENGIFSGVFNANAAIVIVVDGAPFMKGSVDQVLPQITHDTQGTTALEEYMVLQGRDLGIALQNNFYPYVGTDTVYNVAAALLASSNSGITLYGSGHPPSPPIIYYNAQQNMLSDSIREILELTDYDGFTDDNGMYHLFPHDGSIYHPSTGISLLCSADSPSNNIVKVVDHDEVDALDLKNYIVAFGDQVTDGWTEMNADGWQPGTVSANSSITDYTALTPTTAQFGVAAIKVASGRPGIDVTDGRLVFSTYNWKSLLYHDVVEKSLTLKWAMYGGFGLDVGKIWVRLADDQTPPSVIELYNDIGNPLGGGWAVVSIPIPDRNYGHNTDMNRWYDAVTGGVPSSFTWNLTSIEIFSVVQEWFLIDGLTFPNVQLLAYSQDAASIAAYKKRALVTMQTSIGTQKELQAYVNSLLTKRKNPIQRLHLWVSGRTGLVGGVWNWWPGCQVTVNIPALNINGAYRFMEVHNVIERLVEFGHDHLCEVQLVPATMPLETVQWAYGAQPQTALIRRLRDRLRALEQAVVTGVNWNEALP